MASPVPDHQRCWICGRPGIMPEWTAIMLECTSCNVRWSAVAPDPRYQGPSLPREVLWSNGRQSFAILAEDFTLPGALSSPA